MVEVVTTKNHVTDADAACRWRKHCAQSPQQFARLIGHQQQQRHAERWEADAIGRLICEFENLETRAVALRHIAELRDCGVRQVAVFFDIDSEIVVTAISLLPNFMSPTVAASASCTKQTPAILVKAA